MDEIQKLVNIFAKFYNEEKGKGGGKSRIDKKVSMLPMKTSLNLYSQRAPPGGVDPVLAMLEQDLGIEAVERQFSGDESDSSSSLEDSP